MRTVISQSVVLPAPAQSLFAMYTDPAKPARDLALEGEQIAHFAVKLFRPQMGVSLDIVLV